jgi:hypothetical protein
MRALITVTRGTKGLHGLGALGLLGPSPSAQFYSILGTYFMQEIILLDCHIAYIFLNIAKHNGDTLLESSILILKGPIKNCTKN